jgi:hypothetical protein
MLTWSCSRAGDGCGCCHLRNEGPNGYRGVVISAVVSEYVYEKAVRGK